MNEYVTTMTMKNDPSGFIFAADIHLSKLTWQNKPDMIGDSWRSFMQIIDYALEHKLPIILGGDVFDKEQPDSASLQVLYRAMDKMQAAGLAVYFIEGQHEKAQPAWMSAHAWPQHVGIPPNQFFTIASHTFYGINWTARSEIKELVNSIPQNVEFLVMHQVWAEHMGNIVIPELSIHDLPYACTVLTGDYHKHQITEHITAGGKITMVSPGSINMRKIDEDPEKYFYHYDFASRKFQAIQLVTTPKFEVTVSSFAALQQFTEQLDQAIKQQQNNQIKPVVRIYYDAREWDTAYTDIQRMLSKKANLFIVPLEFEIVTSLDMPEPSLIQLNIDQHDGDIKSAVGTLLQQQLSEYSKFDLVHHAIMKLLTDNQTNIRSLTENVVQATFDQIQKGRQVNANNQATHA